MTNMNVCILVHTTSTNLIFQPCSYLAKSHLYFSELPFYSCTHRDYDSTQDDNFIPWSQVITIDSRGMLCKGIKITKSMLTEKRCMHGSRRDYACTLYATSKKLMLELN
jgi:hypothetical protein